MTALSFFVLAVYACFIRWTHAKLEYDAFNFLKYAEIFHRDTFRVVAAHSAPAREPGYPFFLYVLSNPFSGPHTLKVIIAIQFALLFLSAWMVYFLATQLLQNARWAKAVFLLTALSPALMSSAQTLYAETFACFLFTLCLFSLWHGLNVKMNRLSASFFISAIAGAALILTRPAYLHVALFCIPATVLLVITHRNTGIPTASRLIPILLFCTILLTPPFLWMARNKRVYGILNLADHAGIVLKGRYEKSCEAYSLRDVVAATLNSVSESACRAAFHQCERYNWEYANNLGYAAVQKVQNEYGISDALASQMVFQDTSRHILQHPIRFAAFGWFEIVQLAFFETMGTGASAADIRWIQDLQGDHAIRGVVHVVLSVFYLCGILLLFIYTVVLSTPRTPQQKKLLTICFIPVLGHFVIYSMATTVIRYSFVIAPVYILLSLSGWHAWSSRTFRGSLIQPS